jgi:hypothetical protein
MTDNPILQDSQHPVLHRYPSSLSSKQRQAVYQGQVRAFLEASEIVEMEEEVLDDILDGFDGFDHDTDDCVAGEQSFVPVRNLDQDAAGNIELPLPQGFYVYFGPQGMLLAAPLEYRANARVLNPPLDHMAPRWTKQQTRGMLGHLKQRGKRSLYGFGLH